MMMRVTAVGMIAALLLSPDYAMLYWVLDDSYMSDLYRWHPATGSVLIADDVGVNLSGGVISGDWLYYTMVEATEAFDLAVFRIPLNGGGESEFVMDTACYDIPLDSFGTQVYVYAVGIDCHSLYTLDTQTADFTLIADNAVNYYGVAPDGEWLLAEVADDGERVLMRLRPDGSEAVKIMDSDSFTAKNFGWTSDGTLLFTNNAENEQAGIYRIQPDGTGLEQLSSLRLGYHDDYEAHWSPDGLWIAAVWHGTYSHLSIRATTDPDLVLLPDASAVGLLVGGWRPDGGALAFTLDSRLHIFDMERQQIEVIDSGTQRTTFGTWVVQP